MEATDDKGNVGEGLLTWAGFGCEFEGCGDGVVVDWFTGDLLENKAK